MSEAEDFLDQMSIVDGHIGYTVMLADAKKAVSLAAKEIFKELEKEVFACGQNSYEYDELKKRFPEVKK